MYKFYLGDRLIWSPTKADKNLISPSVDLAVNSVGSAVFSVLPGAEYYDDFTQMVSIVTITQDERILFKGRVFGESVDFNKIKTVEVEGILGYLNDSIVRSYEFTGSVEEYFTMLITQHNTQVEDHQKFKIGSITVTDPNDYIVRASDQMPSTWSEITDKLINNLGGYIVIRYEADGNYIDYLALYDDVSTQDIRYSVNLLDLDINGRADELSTCIIAYGAENEDGDRVDLTTVTEDNIDYVYDAEAVALYGRIFEVVTWDDVTLPENLLTRANLYLSNKVKLTDQITIKAIDLNLSDPTIEPFKLGDWVKVYSKPHGIEEISLIQEYDINLFDPVNSVITLGIVTDSYLKQNRHEVNNKIEILRKETSDLVTRTESKILEESQTFVNESIESSEESTRRLLSDYALTTDLEQMRSQVSTEFTQTADNFEMKFNEVSERITNENGETVRRIDDIEKYIRYVDGKIIIGEEGSELTTQIANGRISFIYNDNLEVAYISDSKLYITEGEILTKLQLGRYAFIPRANGNLSFKRT